MVLEESSWGVKSGKSYPKLTKSISADVVVVGAGITGIFIAYVLSKAGIKVVLLEKNRQILQGATLMTTGFITKAIDTSFDELIWLLGEEGAKLVWKSGEKAMDLIAEIINKENIDCEYKTVSAYTYAKNLKQFKKITNEYRAIKKAGFEVALQNKSGKLFFDNAGFMELPYQSMFHAIKFAEALADRAEAAGTKFFVESEVLGIEEGVVKTKEGQINARDIVISTYAPLTNDGTRFKKGMYQSYVFEIEIEKGLFAEGLYQDMHNPFHYFRIDSYAMFDRMIVGGEDKRQDIKVSSGKNFNALEKYVKYLVSGHPYKITRRWDGPILEPSDGLALIGKIKPHTFVATAFSGNGMTYSAISATIIRDLIIGRSNAYVDLYDPLRTSSLRQKLIKAPDYVGEFFGGALKNFFLSNK